VKRGEKPLESFKVAGPKHQTSKVSYELVKTSNTRR
jgi:hypothetical protein